MEKTNKNESRKEKAERRWKSICEGIKKHWIVSAVILGCSGWWFSLILTYFGETLKLVQTVDSNRHLTILGWLFTALVLGATIFFTIVKKYNDDDKSSEIEIETLSSGYKLLDDILVSMGKICNNKSNTQIKEISKIKEGKAIPKDVFTNPCEQLKNILNSISECLALMLTEEGHHVRENDIYVSLAYNFPLESKETWKWAENKIEKGMALDVLLKKENTTISRLLASDEPYLFFNSKQNAYKADQYFPDDIDRKPGGRIRGSIACYKINVKYDNEYYVKSVLSISTYDKCFSKVDEKSEIETIEYNMYEHIAKNFSEQIRVELCNYYMQYLDTHKEHATT